jgi:hypothetical protein
MPTCCTTLPLLKASLCFNSRVDNPEISTDMRWCAIRATQNCLLTNAFPLLLLPRGFCKSCRLKEKTGRGGGDRNCIAHF